MKRTVSAFLDPQKAAVLAGVVTFSLYLVVSVAFTLAEQDTERTFLTFAQPNLSEPLRSLPPEVGLSLPDSPSVRTPVRALSDRYSPIIRWEPVVKAINENGTPEYYAPGLLYSTLHDTPSIKFGTFELACGILVALLAAAATYLLMLPTPSRLQTSLGITLLHVAALFWVFSYFGFFSIHSNDEYHYLDTAKKLLDHHAQFAEYPYPLGLPLLYLPLLLVDPAAEPHLFAAIFSFLNTLVFGTGTILVIMALLRQWGISTAIATRTGVALCLFPVVVSAFHGHLEGRNVFALFLGMRIETAPDTEYMSAYNATDLLGYNALSDMAALFFGLLGILLLARALDRKSSLVPGSAALAFALLIRLPSVFFLLPAAWIVLHQFQQLTPRKLATAAVTAVLVFSPQLVWNTLMFGNPWTFGYKFRPEDYKGFQLALVPAGSTMIGTLHYALLAWGVVALLLLYREHKSRTIPACLSLIAAPPLLFFAGYHGIGTALMRYPLPAVFALITLAVLVYSKASKPTRIPVLSALLLPLVCLPQIPFAALILPLPAWLFTIATLGIGAWVWRSTRQHAWILYTILLLSRRPELQLPAFLATTLIGPWLPRPRDNR